MVEINNVVIFNKDYNNDTYKRKTSKALIIKQYHPSSNVQEKSFLYNIYISLYIYIYVYLSI